MTYMKAGSVAMSDAPILVFLNVLCQKVEVGKSRPSGSSAVT